MSFFRYHLIPFQIFGKEVGDEAHGDKNEGHPFVVIDVNAVWDYQEKIFAIGNSKIVPYHENDREQPNELYTI